MPSAYLVWFLNVDFTVFVLDVDLMLFLVFLRLQQRGRLSCGTTS